MQRKLKLICTGIVCILQTLIFLPYQAQSFELENQEDAQVLQSYVYAQQINKNLLDQNFTISPYKYQESINESSLHLTKQVQGMNAGSEHSKFALILAPTMFTTHNQNLTDLGEASLKSASGTTKGMSVALLASYNFTPSFVGTLFYEHSYADYKGGTMVPQAQLTPGGRLDFNGNSHQWTSGDTFMLMLDKTFGTVGTIGLTGMITFGENGGSEWLTTTMNGHTVNTDRRKINSSVVVTGFSLIYSKPIALSDTWVITPYVSYNPSHVSLKKLNNFQEAPGSHMDASNWSHGINGGIKVKYQAGLLGVEAQLGADHFVSADTSGGYMVRPIGLGISQAGYNVGADRTVAAFSTGLSYVIPGFGVLAAKYTGMLGERTSGHTASVSLIIPF